MKVQVERVLYDSPDTGFHICKAAVLEATQEDNIPKPLLGSLDMLTIKGYFPVSKIVELLVKGSWEKSKYGYALVVNEFKEIIPPTKEGIIAYLSATVYGIKESMAKKIVSQFGLQTLEVFEHSPEQLMAVKGIGRQGLEKIIESYKDSRFIQEIVSYLAPRGVTATKCAKIAKTFGGEAMNILLNEPFRLCEIDGFGFLIVDQIARKTTFSLTDPMRICGAIRYVLQAAAGDGHLCYEQNVCICYAYLLLNDVDYKNARVAKAVEEYFNTLNPQCLRQFVPKTYVPMSLVIEQFKTMALGYELKGDNGYVYLPFEYEQEVDIANMIAKRLTDGRQTPVPDEEITKAIQAQEQSMNILLAEKQKEAVMLGDKVIQTKNNKDIGIYNGDVGYIRRIDTAEDEIEVCFNGSNVTIDSTQLADLDLAYAISIHKAQGSEYNQIIIPVLTAFSIMLKRNLIYTGITRAKKKVVLVGHKRALAQAIRTNVIATRNTQLGRRIIAKLNTQTEE